MGSILEDMDCDGVLTADDCDDNDAHSTTSSEDNDCDGITRDVSTSGDFEL